MSRAARTGIVADRMRSAYRLGNYRLSYVHSGVGFRIGGVNGVMRGGSVESSLYGHARDERSGRRYSYGSSRTWIGFPEWCIAWVLL